MKLDGKVVVVTGAGSGMGREVALEALRRGARVAAVDVNPTTLAETASLADDAAQHLDPRRRHHRSGRRRGPAASRDRPVRRGRRL